MFGKYPFNGDLHPTHLPTRDISQYDHFLFRRASYYDTKSAQTKINPSKRKSRVLIIGEQSTVLATETSSTVVAILGAADRTSISSEPYFSVATVEVSVLVIDLVNMRR